MQGLRLERYGDYLDYLKVHPEEFIQLFNTILINVTGFFRDTAAWGFLATDALPELLVAKKSSDPIRVWSAGCASGEEAYTLAILLAEHLGLERFRQRAKIYATDVDEHALTQARQASYSTRDIQAIPDDLRAKYFEQAGGRFIFRTGLRRGVIFGRHDLVQDAPISRLDLLVCRNTLMYFNSETQSRILARFHFALSDPGVIFLGKAEMLLTRANLFTPLQLKHRIFTTNEELQSTNEELETMNEELQSSNEELQTTNDELRERTDELNRAKAFLASILTSLHVAAVVIDPNFHILRWNTEATELWGLRDNEVHDQSLLSLDIGLPVEQLRGPVRAILRGESTFQELILQATNRRGKAIQCRVTCTPLIGTEADTQGVILLMEEQSDTQS